LLLVCSQGPAEVTATGDVDPTGATDPWEIDGSLRVGDSGNGILDVTDGGVVSNTQGFIGYHSGSTGVATVIGAGSKWTNSANLAVGGTDLNTTFRAYLEPPEGRILHGIGQWHAGNNNFLTALGDLNATALLPASELTFIALGLEEDDLRGWDWSLNALATNLANGNFQGRVPSLSLALRGKHLYGDDYVEGYGIDDLVATTDEYDDRVQEYIDMVIDYGQPVYLRIGGEFSGYWNGYEAGMYPLAFRKIVQMFRDSGADNVAFVWCYEPAAPGDFADVDADGNYLWFPGNDVIDWYGIDVFHLNEFSGGGVKHDRTEAFLAMALEAGKPVVVAESTARDSTITNDSGMATVYWDEWFGPYFAWIDDHEQIKAFHYINADWTVLGHYGESGWGQADITVNPALMQMFVDELGGEQYLHLADIEDLNGYGAPNGTLHVEAGGAVFSGSGSIGSSSGSTGEATVTGADSRWKNLGPLYVGKSGNGALHVEAGGVVSNRDGYIGKWAGSVGTVTVTDEGSEWNNSEDLTVGNYGEGTLNITGGGVVNVGGTTTFGTNSTFEIELSDPTSGPSLFTDNLELFGGTLEISLAEGFLPELDNSFDMLDFSTVSGSFAEMNLPALDESLFWDTSELLTRGAICVGSCPAAVQGDYNYDGVVDAADYTLWQDNLGGASSVLNGNGSGAATVVQADYDLWKTNFEAIGSGSANPVTEPTTVLLVLMAVFCTPRSRFHSCPLGALIVNGGLQRVIDIPLIPPVDAAG